MNILLDNTVSDRSSLGEVEKLIIKGFCPPPDVFLILVFSIHQRRLLTLSQPPHLVGEMTVGKTRDDLPLPLIDTYKYTRRGVRRDRTESRSRVSRPQTPTRPGVSDRGILCPVVLRVPVRLQGVDLPVSALWTPGGRQPERDPRGGVR